MLLNLKELYNEFKKINPDLKVGFSKFASLRPKQCVLAGSTGTHSVCVCVIHQNVKLMCEGVFKRDYDKLKYFDYHTWLNFGICGNPTASCYFSECEQCPAFERLRPIIQSYFDRHEIETVQYNLWTHTDRSNLETKMENVDDFIDHFLDRLPQLLKHSYIVKQQNEYFNNIKDNLKPGEMLVVLDFSENYTFLIQDEVQSYHWTNEQATVHPFGFYYNIENEIQFSNCIIISEIMKHNVVLVDLFINKFIKFIKGQIGTPTKIYYFSDGAASQYKNKTNIWNLTKHEQKYGISAEWNFFGTSHGKNVSDGLGGTLKRLVSRASIQSTESVINSPNAMYNWAVENIKNMNFVYATNEEYTEAEELFFKLCPKLKPVPKTQSVHHVQPLSDGKVKTRFFSQSSEFNIYSVIK